MLENCTFSPKLIMVGFALISAGGDKTAFIPTPNPTFAFTSIDCLSKTKSVETLILI